MDESLGFEIVSVQTVQMSLSEVETAIDPLSTTFYYSANFHIDLDNDQVGVLAAFATRKNQNFEPLMEVAVMVLFYVEELNEYISEEEDYILLPLSLARSLASVAMGTARGVGFARTEHTPLANLVLPILNVLDVVPDDSEFVYDDYED